ncbi:MAG TPA: MBL fold metallo-hydrolase [Rectinemataceae bacterium]|nr:MBL fold metallo-hydrolase [Rectinemataceae bacterium]
MKLQLIRSATIKLFFQTCTILVDPCLAPKFGIYSYAGISKNPLVELPMPLEDILGDIDAVIVSHLHSDHFDSVARQIIKKDIPLFCQPDDEAKIRELGFTDARPVQESAIFRGVEMRRFYGQHGHGSVLEDMGIVSGFSFKAEGAPSICWLGDTVLIPAVEKRLLEEMPDIVVAHSSGAVWGSERIKIVLDEEQTVRICALLPGSRIIATHMDSLDHGTVTRKQLRAYAEGHSIAPEALIIPEDGEMLTL